MSIQYFRKLFHAAAATAGIGKNASVIIAKEGMIGQPLTLVRESEFFKWFHLEEMDSWKLIERAATRFEPTNPDFHNLVSVDAITKIADRRNLVTEIELWLNRRFIDDPTDGIFARDIAKSFLGAVPRPQEIFPVHFLINRIEFDLPPGRPVLTARKPPNRPRRPVPGYDTFLGGDERFRLALGASALTLENYRHPDHSATLRIAFVATP